MKNKYHNELKILNYITTTERYKLIFWLSVILCLYGGFVLGISKQNFFESLLVPLQFPIFNVFFFSIIFLNNINACSVFKNEFPNYILRLKNKKTYIRSLIRLSLLMFLFHFIIVFLLLLMILLLTTSNDLSIIPYQNYSINIALYLLFYCIRYIIFGMLITIISTLIFVNMGSKFTLLVDGIFLALLFYLGNIISLKTNFSISIWSYFTITLYSSFSMELSCSLFMALILEIIVILLYWVSIHNKRVEIL